MIVREKPLVISQKVLIWPRRRRYVTPSPIRGVIEGVELEKTARTKVWVYYVRQEDGCLNTYSDPQLAPLTILDEIALA